MTGDPDRQEARDRGQGTRDREQGTGIERDVRGSSFEMEFSPCYAMYTEGGIIIRIPIQGIYAWDVVKGSMCSVLLHLTAIATK